MAILLATVSACGSSDDGAKGQTGGNGSPDAGSGGAGSPDAGGGSPDSGSGGGGSPDAGGGSPDSGSGGGGSPEGGGGSPDAAVDAAAPETVVIGNLTWEAEWNANNTDVLGAGGYDWAAADAYCANLVLGGQTDWRLPTAHELVLSMDYTTWSPAVDLAKFPGTPDSAELWASDEAHPYASAGDGGAALTYRWGADLNKGELFSYGTASSLAPGAVRCVRGTSPTGQLADNGDGTVTDPRTGLIWQQAEGSTTYTQAEAAASCAGLSLGGSGPGTWRLPTITELDSIVDRSRPSPMVDPVAFPDDTGVMFWTSTVYAGAPGYAWYQQFNSGVIEYDVVDSKFHARCVR